MIYKRTHAVADVRKDTQLPNGRGTHTGINKQNDSNNCTCAEDTKICRIEDTQVADK